MTEQAMQEQERVAMVGCELLHGDCLELLRAMADKSVDLVMTSPPYEAARTYGIDFNLRGQAWVDWAVERYIECVRVSRGLVCWVIEGQTRDFRWSATPALFMADLHRKGVMLRHPVAYVRGGIPGSGGKEWIKNKWEFCVCGTANGRLPWSDNTAMGHAPKYGAGGAPSHRRADGTRANGCKSSDSRPSGVLLPRAYVPPKISNPGNWLEFPDEGAGVDCGPCGGGHLGWAGAHENEAPYPEKLAEFFIRSFCHPDGTVLDPFCGSGTTCAVAAKHGRRSIGIDVRESQIDLTRRRLAEIKAPVGLVAATGQRDGKENGDGR